MILYILKVLTSYNDRLADKELKYSFRCVLRDDKIIRVVISKNIITDKKGKGKKLAGGNIVKRST